MSNDILSVLQFMEKEKGITREEMISVITGAIKNAAQRGVNAGQDLKVEVDAKTGSLQAWTLLTVVDTVGDPATEIHIDKAKAFKMNPGLGEIIEQEIDPSYLGRIAAQTARQAIMQRLRQFEKDRLYEDYKNSVGDILSGIVRRREKGDLYIDIGKSEAVLPSRERVPGEDYAPGERIRCLLVKIDSTPRGPELVLSRSHPNFVRRLFELEVTEIADGTVIIQKIAREPGYRTKMCVNSTDTKVDPVGACVGARGARVKTIVRELAGEKIDIIRYHKDPIQLLHEAIKPAVPKNIEVDRRSHRIHFEVEEKDLSIAIGKKGQNAKLTSKLMGWALDISKERSKADGFEQRKKRAIQGINQIEGLTDAQAELLVSNGITSPEAFEGVTADDLAELGFSTEEAEEVLQKVNYFISK